MVGARGFEPPTPWSRNASRCSNVLILLVRCCVVVHRFSWYSGRLDPRLDPTFVPLHSVICLEPPSSCPLILWFQLTSSSEMTMIERCDIQEGKESVFSTSSTFSHRTPRISKPIWAAVPYSEIRRPRRKTSGLIVIRELSVSGNKTSPQLLPSSKPTLQMFWRRRHLEGTN